MMNHGAESANLNSTMVKRLRHYFLVGAIAVAPLGITIYILILLFGWFDSLFQPLIRGAFSIQIPGLGIILGLTFILLIGIVAPSLVGRQIFRALERLAERLPLAKLIYSGTKQIFDSFSQSNLQKFSRVVLVPFPMEGSYSLGFVTQEFPSEWHPQFKEKRYCVFVPTTPNPTSGYLLFLADHQLVSLNLSVEEALKIIISGGLAKSGPKLANSL